MNFLHLLNDLNDKQRKAVTALRGNLLVLAGAGSGKTRVLVHRIVWLYSIENCPPYSIMAVTFTNKAAKEMRNRIIKFIDINQHDMFIGTFHSLAYRLLCSHYIDAKLPKDFQILDNEDQFYLLKRLIKTMNLDEDQWSPRKAMRYINHQKDKGIRPRHIKNFNNSIERTWTEIYQNYQEICNRAGLVDFSELLLRSYELWISKPHILQYYRERFSNILIDEFQDINNIQYAWIRLLAGETSKVMIVGDDDQSIYGWRGAETENIQNFLRDFSNVKTIFLEQNYRSTGNILNAANTLIKKNNGRFDKKLWTNGVLGEPISLYCALNELDEAHFVINQIKIWLNNGGLLSQCAILYRNNAQSRVFEEVLLQENIPYCIYGGLRFFERKEIKDTLSYLRLISNFNDDSAFERVINTPPRGIGNHTLNKIRQFSQNNKLTLWQTCQKLLKEKILVGRPANALKNFLKLIEFLKQKTKNLPLHIQTDQIIRDSGLWTMYQKKKNNLEKTRLKNLEELVTATYQFHYSTKNGDLTPLQAFLSYAVLEKEENQVTGYQGDAIQLMTLHSAKGLEFPQVFIVGMEETIFPNQISLDKSSSLEEERRLAYVGVTRAMKKLTLTYSRTRLVYGKEIYFCPSRFISEIPKKYLKEI